MSVVRVSEDQTTSNNVPISHKSPARQRKVLEEDEYLDRMAKIIRRDFFLDLNSSDAPETPSQAFIGSERSGQTYSDTPATDRTDFTSTSTVKSRRAIGSMRLNEYLDKYTSEDNSYFEKLQRKDLKRHKTKFPWLYTDRNNHNKHVSEQLKLAPGPKRLAIEGQKSEAKIVDWHFNPKNTLFYPPNDEAEHQRHSTVNYESSKYMKEPIFKEPFPSKTTANLRGLNRFTDKIGIDGKLMNGSDTPSSMDGFSFSPLPETPKILDDLPRSKQETNRYYIPSESPRDDLAHRLYEEKIAKKIRTPKTSTRSDSTKTPKSRLDKIF